MKEMKMVTNSAGTAHLRLLPQTIAKLELVRPNEVPRPLSSDELQELFAKGSLTIRW
jgi:hypothetical protein